MSSYRSSASAEPFTNLLARAREGQMAAMNELLDIPRDHLLEVARQRMPEPVRERERPSDAVQVTLMAANKHFQQFDGESSQEFSKWLLSILLNTISDFRRAIEGRRKPHDRRETSLDDVPAETLAVPRSAPSVCDALADKEQREILVRCVESLPESHREIVKRFYQDGGSFVQIGEALGMSADAARKKFQRGMQAVAELIHVRGIIKEGS